MTKNSQNLAAAQQVQNESRSLLEDAKERARKEAERRDAIIMQIRALDMTPVDRSKTVDPTATAGHGFLSEMSFAELQERLNMLKVRAHARACGRRARARWVLGAGGAGKRAAAAAAAAAATA